MSSSCVYCGLYTSPSSGLYACTTPADCSGVNSTVISTCTASTANPLTSTANIVCTENNTAGSSETFYGAYDERIYFSDTRVDVVAHFVAFAGITSTNNPPLLGFQYVAAAGFGNPQINNSFVATDYGGIGAFWTILYAFEFIPGPNDGGIFNPNTSTVVSVYNFTQYTVQGCSSTVSKGVTTYYITYTDPNGWKIVCRLADAAILDPTGHPISPVGAKCDFTIGNYPYTQANTYLGFFTVFFADGFAAEVVAAPTIKSCAANSFCLTSASSEFAGQFSYAGSLTSGKTIGVTSVSVYESATGVATPTAPSSFGSGNNTVYVDVQAFAAAAFTVFAVNHPAAGDVWDPSISLSQPTESSHLKGSATSVTYSLILIIAALLHKFL